MRRLASVAMAILLLAACVSDGATTSVEVDERPSDSTATAGEVSTPDEGTAPTGSTPAETTTSAAGTPPSSGSSTTRFAVVAAIDGALGWYDGNTWVQAQTSLPVDAGDEFQVYRVGAQPSSTVAVETTPGCELAQPSIGVDLEPDPWAGGLDIFGPNPVVVSAPWDTAPHGVFPIEASPEYTEIASSLLAEIGVDDPEPRFAQLLRTDMDGNGVNEVFAVAERRSDPSGSLLDAPPGDYSLAFARVVVGEDVRTHVLAQWVVTEPEEEGFIADLVIHRFDAFMDPDDDGVDEFALRSTYYEGSGVALYDYRGPDVGFVAVVSAACGA